LTLYALGGEVPLAQGADGKTAVNALVSAAIGTAALTATYSRS
jgi:hypothetical protein